MKRVQGYVVGYDTKAGELVWTVKVKDQSSLHRGKKFEVASLRPGTMLTKQGVDVTFRVREFALGQEKVLKAIDVSVGSKDPDEDETAIVTPSDSMSFALVEENGTIYAWYNECESREECAEWLKGQSEECHLIGFLRVNAPLLEKSEVFGFDEDARAAFNGLREMMAIDAVSNVIQAIVTEAFMIGTANKR